MRNLLLAVPACLVLLGTGACQDYPFEGRQRKVVQAQKIDEVVATARPTDILFIIDNSGTMEEERRALKENITTFVEELLKSTTDFQIGIVTTDAECNTPDVLELCASPAASAATKRLPSPECCTLRGCTASALSTGPFPFNCAAGVACSDDQHNCDGGRLRRPTGDTRYFPRPQEGQVDAWITEFRDALTALDCNVPQHKSQGSPYEAGLETALRAVSCAVTPPCDPALDPNCVPCPDPAIAQVNAGFVRAEADLVLIFMTDEDDCSFRDLSVYGPMPANSAIEQARHFCGMNECYAYYNAGVDSDHDGIDDWGDSNGVFKCKGVARVANPPLPDSVSSYLDRIIAVKGNDVARVRAAAILGSVPDTAASLGFTPAACYTSVAVPSRDCGCLSTSTDSFYCTLTASIGQANTHMPEGGGDTYVACGVENPEQGGCQAMPGGRYVEFLRDLSTRREAALVRSDTLVDSICGTYYDQTLYAIVNNVILSNCFELGVVPQPKDGQTIADVITVNHNGQPLPNVPVNSPNQGWSWVPGTAQVCLEGGLQKTINDRYEIFFLTPPETQE